MITRIKNPWVVCLCAAGFFCFEFFQINMFNALDPSLIKTFGVDGKTLSILSAVYFWGVVLLLLPAGILLDRLSTRKLILSAMALSIIGSVIFAVSTNFWMAVFGRFLVGVSGGPFCLLSIIRLASRWFPENKLAFVTGMVVSIGMIGGAIAQTPFTMLVDSVGWRQALFADIAGGTLIYILLFLVVYDCPPGKEKEYEEQKKHYHSIGFVPGLKSVVLKLQNWYCGIFAALLNLPIFLLGALWGSLYLTQVHGLTRMDASIVTTMLFIGMLIGSPTFGRFSDTVGSRKLPMMLGTLVCLFSLIAVMKIPNLSMASLIVLFLIMGFSASAQVIVYPTVAESNPPSLTGSAEGLAAVFIMSGGAVFQPVFGWLIEAEWNGAMSGQLPLYSLENYNMALLLMPTALIVCLLMLALMKETNCRRSDTQDEEDIDLIDENETDVSMA